MVGTFRVEAKLTADLYVLKANVNAVHKVLIAFASGFKDCGENPVAMISHFTAESFIQRLDELGFEVVAKKAE